MANWVDVLSLIVTVSIFGGILYGVFLVMGSISQGVESTKQSLKEKGLHISDKGVEVKTAKRFDREDYVDATQRNLVKAISAASFGDPNHQSAILGSAGLKQNNDSSSSINSEKKRSLFGKKRQD
ncbi:hypothetical protein C8J56DRAFT_592447 [Mycena floridula]|nr:hypothetical protein C8J56DRAFT_592447 [Mycena floridula]